MRLFCFLLLILSLAPASEPQGASHVSDSGNGFLEACKSVERDFDQNHAFDSGICMGWIQGFVEGLTVSDEFRQTPAEKRMICPSKEVTLIQFFRVVKKHIDEQPERAHLATRYLASEALVKAFPCGK
jgi:hypothetical protein